MTMALEVIAKVIHNFWHLIIAIIAGMIYAQKLNNEEIAQQADNLLSQQTEHNRKIYRG